MTSTIAADIPLDDGCGVASPTMMQWHPVNTFRIFYCLIIAGVICMHHSRHACFYRWFVGSGLEQEQRRGLGYAAVRPYGLFEPPRLTVVQFHAVGCGLVSCLLLACLDSFAPRVFLWCAFLLYFLYFSQLFCESKAGGHSTVMIPTTLFMLALASPDMDAIWPLEVLKMFLALAYCASGCCKVAGSIYFRRFWGNGPTLQCYIYEAMWTRPAHHPALRWAQELLLCSPYLCTVLGWVSLVFEAGFPAILLTPNWCTVALGAGAALAFHAGIELLMGLDFLSYWCPVLLVFAAKDTAALLTSATTEGDAMVAISAALRSIATPQSQGFIAALHEGFAAQPVAVTLAVIYLIGQILVSFTFRDIVGEEKLPFSCCPMFFFPRNLFSATPKLFCISGANWRRGGYLDCSWLYNQAFVPPFELREEDMSRLQFPLITFGTLSPMPDVLSFRVKPKYRNQPFVLFTNVAVGPELRNRLESLLRVLTDADEADAWCIKKLRTVLDLQKECQALFTKCHRIEATTFTPDITRLVTAVHGKTE